MKITFLGGGNMASALIGGLLAKGFPATDVAVLEPGEEARQRLTATHRVSAVDIVPENLPGALDCDVVVLSVKPQQMQAAVAPLAPYLGRQLVISIAAGLPLAVISGWLGGYRKMVRAMPNTPAMIGAGITGLFAYPEVDATGRSQAQEVVEAVGSALWIDDEAQMDGVTALSGSGPAYVFLFIEALQEAGLKLGFNAEQVRAMAVETVLGAARLAALSPEPVSVLRERVTSKGGTTEAALKTMAEAQVKAGIMAGVAAAEARGRELGAQLAGTSGTAPR